MSKRHQNKKQQRGAEGTLSCTACYRQINPNKPDDLKQHPVLKVLICKRCYGWYTSDDIDQDSNGLDEQCRWCGEGGQLVCCDYCHNAFCKVCIKHNLGRAELSTVIDADDDIKWHCYVCNPKPLAELVDNFRNVMEDAEKNAANPEKRTSAQKCSGKNGLNITDLFSNLNNDNVVRVLDKLIPASETMNIVLPSMKEKLVKTDCDDARASLVSKVRNVLNVFMKTLNDIKQNDLQDGSKMNGMSEGATSSVESISQTSGESEKEETADVESKQRHSSSNPSPRATRSRADIEVQRQLHRELLLDSSSSSDDEEDGSAPSENESSSLESDSDDEDKDNSDNDYNPKEDRQIEKRLGQERKESEEKVKVKKAYKRKLTRKEKQVEKEKQMIDLMKKKRFKNVPAFHDSESDEEDEKKKLSVKKKKHTGDTDSEEEDSEEKRTKRKQKKHTGDTDSEEDTKKKVVKKKRKKHTGDTDSEEEQKSNGSKMSTEDLDSEDDVKNKQKKKQKEKQSRQSHSDDDVSEETTKRHKKKLTDEIHSEEDEEEKVKKTNIEKISNKSDSEEEVNGDQKEKSKKKRSDRSDRKENTKKTKRKHTGETSSEEEQDIKSMADRKKAKDHSEESNSDDSEIDLKQEKTLHTKKSKKDDSDTEDKENNMKTYNSKDKKNSKKSKVQRSEDGENEIEKLLDTSLPLNVDGASDDIEDEEMEAKNKSGKNEKSKGATEVSKKKSKKQNGAGIESDSSAFDSDLENEIDTLCSLPKRKDKKQKSKEGKSDKKKKDGSAKENGGGTQSDSSAYDSDLENEIDTLCSLPKRKEKKQNGTMKNGDGDVSSDDSFIIVKTDEAKKSKKGGPTKNKEKVNKIDALDSDDSNVDCDSDSQDEKEQGEKTDQEKAAELEQDRQRHMLFDVDDSDQEDSEEEEESDEDVDSSSEQSTDAEGNNKKSKKEKRAKDLDGDLKIPTGGEKKKRKKKSKLLTEKLTDDSDSDVVIVKSKKQPGSDVEVISDSSDVAPKKKKQRKRKKASSDSDDAGSSDSDGDGNKKKGKKRKRIKKQASSDSEGSMSGDGEKKKKMRRIIKDKKLSETTKSAAKAEDERRARIKERQKRYNQQTEEDSSSPMKIPKTTKLVLDEDGDTVLEVHPEIIKQLKPHQVEAVKFLWECVAESVERLQKEPGSGCILAHCMGLGKTLSIISFTHTMLYNHEVTKIRSLLVLCPLNTVLNWQDEWEKWVPGDVALDVYEMSAVKTNESRLYMLQEWIEGGGVMIMGYEMYRNLSSGKNIKKKKLREAMTKTLLTPGPDMIVCDEGHILKNCTSATFKAVNAIKTKRRIVLTGTPLQNNLGEYHCMVDFVKENLLGTRKEFSNRFVNPITYGQCSDSTSHAVSIMKKRAHILHETLAGCVQRKDYSALTKFLLPKFEYVISIRLSEIQIKLYRQYLERYGSLDTGGKGKGSKLFADYQFLKKIFTHPWTLKMDEVRQEHKNLLKDEEDFVDDDSYSEKSFSGASSSESEPEEKKKKSKRNKGSGSEYSNSDEEVVSKKWKTRSRRRGRRNAGDRLFTESESEASDTEASSKVSDAWWADQLTPEDQHRLGTSGKLVLMAEILKMCDDIGDKLLVFSQSLLSLDLIEKFLVHWDETGPQEDEKDEESKSGCFRTWVKGADYFRMDGSTSVQCRKAYAECFNDEENHRARLFLISTKAGGLGTNMIGANRVIMFDASWNPTHDTQSVFRVFRFGQTKPVYIYRFVAQGTMEEKIYERQVTKLSLSQRVVDEHQIERHFTQSDLSALYNFNPDVYDEKKEKPVFSLPKDRMLADLLSSRERWIVSYHEHDSLLENKIDEELSEEDRKAAWEEYEAEKKGLRQMASSSYDNYQRQVQQMQGANNHHIAEQQRAQHYNMMNALAQRIFSTNPGISHDEVQRALVAYMQKYGTQLMAQPQAYNAYGAQQHLARLSQEQVLEEQRRVDEHRRSELLMRYQAAMYEQQNKK